MITGLRAAAIGLATGLAVALVGTHGYSLLAGANVRLAPGVPWGPALAVPLLWLFWRWLGGAGWPRSSSSFRRRMRRANPLPRGARGRVALAALAGFVFAGAAMTLGLRLSDLPPDAVRAPPLPMVTLVPAVVMLSLVAGVCEEVGLRGYLQKPLEDAGRPVAAILLSSATFVLLHASHEGFLAQAAPMFLAALWYGAFTARTDSILPMIAIHALLDLVSFGHVMILGGSLPRSVHQDGFTPAFWVNLAVAAAAMIAAFLLTARIPARPAAGAVLTSGR